MRAGDEVRPHSPDEGQEVIARFLQLGVLLAFLQQLENPRLVRGIEVRQISFELPEFGV